MSIFPISKSEEVLGTRLGCHILHDSLSDKTKCPRNCLARKYQLLWLLVQIYSINHWSINLLVENCKFPPTMVGDLSF